MIIPSFKHLVGLYKSDLLRLLVQGQLQIAIRRGFSSNMKMHTVRQVWEEVPCAEQLKYISSAIAKLPASVPISEGQDNVVDISLRHRKGQ